MKINVISIVFPILFLATGNLFAEKTKPNYDESKVPKFVLPDPLQSPKFGTIKTPEDWFNKRRPELLALFKKEVYGQMPGVDPLKINFETLTSVSDALSGKATRKEVRVYFDYPNKEPKIDLLIYIPNKRKGPVPAFLGYNYKGNHSIVDDPDVAACPPIEGSRYGKVVPEEHRAENKHRWSLDRILDAGYALISGCYEQVDPDRNEGYNNGIHLLFKKEFPDKEVGDFPANISGWAWALSRVLDCLEKMPEINAKKVIVIGHSRLGKTALWAGANDTRFAGIISNNSGCGGAALSKRAFGETVELINLGAPHWFCKNFKKYNKKEEDLTIDQHELIALIAPRPVYIASATLDEWADPKGEFLSGFHADPVYKLLGADGIGDCKEWPPADHPVGKKIRYHLRTGKHDVTDYDWVQYIKFADELVK
ncbi:MAG: acetylxylan esterase [Kiritimatiellae bacterium]|nr:acetylxylan esterase [Kiritimatiellia bacterium]MDD5523311.1 acetylxylan esterase [Kiritimatiellia bacterium]